MKKKILFIITKSNWGGAQRYVYDLATGLPRDRFEVSVAFGGTGLPHAETGLLKERLDAAGIRTLPLKHFARDIFFMLDVRAFFELWRLLERERPDVLHLNSSKAGGLGALAGRLAGIPRIVFTSHGLAYEEDRGTLAKTVLFCLTWLTFFLCHRVILITRNNYEQARGLPFLEGKLMLVHNGIGPPPFLAADEARKKLAERIEKRLEGPLLGTIAELTKNKGLVYALEGMALLRDRNIPFHGVIIGSGEDEEQLASELRDRGLAEHVFLAGHVKDAARYLYAFDVFFLSSIKEGLPYVLLEAGHAGRAVAATRTGGIPDVVLHERTGLLAEPRDGKGLGNLFDTLLSRPDLRESYGTALKKYVKEDFSLEAMLKATERAYS